jgi:hypothetical protein
MTKQYQHPVTHSTISTCKTLSPSRVNPASSICRSTSLNQSDRDFSMALPKVGQTRCCKCSLSCVFCVWNEPVNAFCITDWALLSANLDFIYLDPVLSHHLDGQRDALIGKSLLSFIHPDEVASAQDDLRKVIESKALHGSVTRYVPTHATCASPIKRRCSSSIQRTLLAAFASPPLTWP